MAETGNFHGPMLRDDLPRYPALLQLVRVTATTVPGPSGVAQVAGSSVLAPILYVAFTQQQRTNTLLPVDREPCLAADVNGLGLTPGFYLGRLANTWTSLPVYEITALAGSTGSGTQGAAGPQGPTGSKGDPGTQGTQGPQGPQGPTGSKGDPGTQGTQGPQGPAGPAGSTGPQGPQGPQGPAGSGGSGSGTTATNGESAIGSYTVTSSWADTGAVVTLPDAGTYLITCSVAASINSGTNGDLIRSRLYNNTDSQVISDVLVSCFLQGASLSGGIDNGTATHTVILTTLGSNRSIRLQAEYFTVMAPTAATISSARLDYVRLA